MKVVVGVTGASGSALALKTLELLRDAGAETHLVVSRGAETTIAHELGRNGLRLMMETASAVHDALDLAAPIASGSFPVSAMAVIPCSMRTLAAVSHGFGDNLLTRAADVALKERRRLVICPREAPLTEAHLKNMLALTRMGAVVAPPVPPFYTLPATMEDMVRELAARVVNWMGVDPGLAITRWSGERIMSGQASHG